MTATRDSSAIHTLLSQRRSPYSLDPQRAVPTEDLLALFEAARWAASSFNAQPWRYIIGVKDSDDGLWEKIHGLLLSGNQPWTRNAPVLALGIMQTDFDHNGKPNAAAMHDLGAASAQLTLEATARGLVVHQMGGLRTDDAHSAFELSANLQVVTALAIGYAGSGENLDAEIAKRDGRPRERKPLNEILLAGMPELTLA